MDYKLLFVALFLAVGVALGSSLDGSTDDEREGEGLDTPCPEPTDDRHGRDLHFKRSFGNCMRRAMMMLRNRTGDCREAMFGVKHCMGRDRERCMSQHDGTSGGGGGMTDEERRGEMERHLNDTVDEFIPVFCDRNFTVLPPFNRRNDSLPGCEPGYFAEINRCSADFETHFRADPLDAGLCERSRNMKECQRGKLRDHCSRDFVTEEYLERTEEQDDAGNFYCDSEALASGDDDDVDDGDAAPSLRASLAVAFPISVLLFLRAN